MEETQIINWSIYVAYLFFYQIEIYLHYYVYNVGGRIEHNTTTSLSTESIHIWNSEIEFHWNQSIKTSILSNSTKF